MELDENGSEIRKFKGFLHLNYKTGKMEYLKRKIESKNPYVVVFGLDVEVVLPKPQEVLTTKVKVVIPDVKLKEAMVNEL